MDASSEAARTSTHAPGSTHSWDLDHLDHATNFHAWLASRYAPYVRGRVLEVGAGIGTYTRRLLELGAEQVVAVEPESACADALEQRFGDDGRVTILRQRVPSLRLAALAGTFDLVLCQNVVEHIDDDAAAAAALANAVAPTGFLVVLVPAHARLFGSLDRSYGHRRRYSRDALVRLVEGTGLDVIDLQSFNLLGVAGWVLSSWRHRQHLDPRALALYDRLVPLWRRIETILRPRWGLSLILVARRP